MQSRSLRRLGGAVGARCAVRAAAVAIAAVLGIAPGARAALDAAHAAEIVRRGDFAALREAGPGVVDVLVELYPHADVALRTEIAGAFYFLGWKSEPAKRVLLEDVHTSDERLRLSVHWALGRVSDSPDVVAVLLENMMRDPNPLFRDKAACALANDQIHLSEVQKVRLFAGLIEALASREPQVRRIALQALQIQTGQTRGFAPDDPVAKRAVAIESWRAWLDEYRAQL